MGPYIQTGNGLNVGDNIPWHAPLDDVKTTAVRHMIITRDTQLGECQAPFGHFEFRQVWVDMFSHFAFGMQNNLLMLASM